LNGVTANFFTVAGATSVTHSANSGVITAVFPATAKLSQSITFATPIDMTVGGSTQTVAPTASSSLTVTLTSTTTGVCTVLEFVITAVASGTCSITASQAGNANYEAAPDVIKTFASRATQSITFTFFPADVSFGTNPAGLGAISTSGLTVAFTTATSDVCTVSGTTVTVVSVGTCTINANQEGNLNFEPASQVAQSFTIAKATPSLSSFANVSKSVGDASFSLTAPTVANSLLGSFTYTSATTATATISGATVTLGSAGTTLITATFTPTDAVKYNNATITMTLTLSVAAPAFTLSSSSETRTVNTAATGFSINSTGGAIASFAISATPPGMSFDTSTGALTGTPTTVASATAYTVTATNATGSTTQTFTLTVSRATQATLSITSLTTSSKDYPYEQALSITTSGGSGSGATTFAITSGGSASNCALSNSTSTATITATTIGTCRIQATKAADSTYDEITSAAATFIFDKTSQSITFTTPLPMRFGGFNQSVTPTASSSLTVTLTSTSTGICTVAGFVITAVGSGTCSITASQAGNSNYLAAFDVIRTFGILKATQSISFTTPSAMTVGESNQSVSPTSSSSLTVTLTSTTLDICTVAGFVITAVSPGTCSITASRAGNTSYEAASDVIQTFAITGVINVAAIGGITAPVTGATPVNTTTAGTGYTGAVSWASSGGSLVGNFAAATIYTATITLTATSNYTLSGVSANFFTVAGATSVTHSADSGVITAVFPATAKATQATLSITSLTTSTTAYPYSQALSITTSGGSGSGATTFAITSGGTASGCSLSDSTATATITATTIGTCLIQATKAADVTYDATTSAAATFTFTKATQSITFTTPSAMTVGGSTQTVAPTASSSLTVTLTSTTTSVCTVAGFVITAVGPGTCSITASQAGNTNYEAASEVIQTFAITGVINVAAIAGITAPVIGAIPVDTVTATSQYTGNVYWEPSAGTFAAATVYTATITLTPKSGYTLTGVSADFFTITGATSVTHLANSGVITAVFPATAKLSQSITFTDPADISYGISPSSLSATSNSGLTVAFTSATSGVCTVSGTTVTIVSAGTCTINASQAGNANYEAASQVSQSFTISKASQSITFTDPEDITYGQSPSSLSATSTSTLTVAFTTATSGVCAVTGTTVTVLTAGTCTINANQAGDTNYVAASQVSQSFIIAKATPSLSSFNDTFRTKDVPTFTLIAPTVANSLPGSFTYASATTATATISGDTVTLGNVGTTVITATFTPTDATNYNNASIQMTLTVSRATQATLSITSLTTNSKTYSQLSNSQTLSITTSGGSGTGAITFAIALGGSATACALSNATATATVSANSAGTCWIRATKAADSIYEARSSETFTFTFTKATPTLSDFPNLSKTIGDAAFDLTLPTSAPPIEGSFTFSSATTATATISSQRRVTLGSTGSTVITATFTPSDTTNYNNATISMTLTVDPPPPSFELMFSYNVNLRRNVAATGLTIRDINGFIERFTINATPSGMSFNEANGELTGTPNTVAGATNYTITATNAWGTSSQTFALTVLRATQSITFTDPADITFGQSPASLSATSTSTLTVAFTTATSGVCTVSGTTVTIQSLGTCTINANQAGNADYEAATQVSQSFAITKGTPSLSNFGNVSKTVGDASFTLTAPTVANSLPGSFTYTSSTTATATISGDTVTLGNVGTTVITATFTPTDTVNYNNATITMTLTVSTRTCANGGVCAVGDRGPGGGYVFYVSATNFTSSGSTCNTSCKYLEVAPVTWTAEFRVNDARYPWGSPAWVVAQNFGASTEGFADDERVNWQIGQGFYNTSFMSGTTAVAVRAYAGNAAAGEWFIPSMNELNELCKYVWGQTTGDLKVQCSGGSSGNFKSPDGFVQDFYWSSTQYAFSGNLAWMQDFKQSNQGNRFYESKENSWRVRPIRAFGP